MKTAAHLLCVTSLAFLCSCSRGAFSAQEVPLADLAAGDGEVLLSLSEARLVKVPDSDLTLAVWEHRLGPGREDSAVAVKRGGSDFGPALRTRFELAFRRERFDPLQASADAFSATERAQAVESLYVVQFWAPVLPELLAPLEKHGARALRPFPRHAYLMRLDERALAFAQQSEHVRAVVPFSPAHRVDLGRMAKKTAGPRHFLLLPSSDAPEVRGQLAAQLESFGAKVNPRSLGTYLLDVTLDERQLALAAALPEVLHVDPWSAPEPDMDKARAISGADALEQSLGLGSFALGLGVRGEVMDGNVEETHPDLKGRPVLFHGTHSGDASHGTATTGIVFGDGSGNAQARGLLPVGQPIFADYDNFFDKGDRKAHTAELLAPPYQAVFQSNSWGSTLTKDYTNVSAEMDALIFELDFLIFNSQSNTGTTDSRPQAWAKNIVSVGGVKHQDTLDTADDKWDRGGSIGPASDGRIKPDLAHFWDKTLAPTTGGGYRDFGGTSGATPITAGYAGLFHQLWAMGLFGTVTPGTTVFESRPHFTTAKAMLVNTATQWAFEGAEHDLTRVHQGWGRVDLQRMLALSHQLLVVDETALLTAGASQRYEVTVADGTPELRATLTWADPPAVPSAGIHRVNDLTLKVTAPDGTVYFGNHGLKEGLFSQPGGQANSIDTLENVFVQLPAAGTWVVEVRADEVAQDGHRETPEVDADFALVVSGIQRFPAGHLHAVSVSAPAAGATVSGVVNVEASVSAADAPLARVRFGLPDGSFVDVAQPPFSASFDTAKVKNGPAEVTLVAIDERGLASAPTVLKVTVDNPAPEPQPEPPPQPQPEPPPAPAP